MTVQCPLRQFAMCLYSQSTLGPQIDNELIDTCMLDGQYPLTIQQERIMTSFLFGREEEERVTSYSGRGESACTINSTSGRVVASVQVKREKK